MKKITLGLLIAGISTAVIALSGCGGSSGTAAPAPGPAPTTTPLGGTVAAPGGVIAYAPATFYDRLAKLVCDTAYALTGVAPVANAPVAMYNVDVATGLPVGAPVAGPVLTDATGKYTLNVPNGEKARPSLQVLIYPVGTALSTTAAPAAAPALRTIPTAISATAVANVDPMTSFVAEFLRAQAVAAGGDFNAVAVADIATMSAAIAADPVIAAAVQAAVNTPGATLAQIMASTAAAAAAAPVTATLNASISASIANNPVKTASFVLKSASATGTFTYDMTRNATYRFLSGATVLNTRLDVASGTTVVTYVPATGVMSQTSNFMISKNGAAAVASSTNIPALGAAINAAGQMVLLDMVAPIGLPRVALPTTLDVGASWTAHGSAGYLSTASTVATFTITAIGGTRNVTSSVGTRTFTDVVTVTVSVIDYSLGVPMHGTGTIYISPSAGGVIEQSTTATGAITPTGMGPVPAGATADASVTETLILR